MNSETLSSVPSLSAMRMRSVPDALHLFTVEDRPETKSRVLDPVKDLKTAMEELELEYINHAYEKYGNVREAAESLGMTPSTFVRKRQKYTKDAD
ncbi:MAG: helix-turn-helix domain-containing protein [Lachnospiraceae bacterium]